MSSSEDETEIIKIKKNKDFKMKETIPQEEYKINTNDHVSFMPRRNFIRKMPCKKICIEEVLKNLEEKYEENKKIIENLKKLDK